MNITTQALVLREVNYKEADKILTVLTQKEGKLTVRARGALRKGCKYAAAAQTLTLSEMTLFGNRGRWSLNEAETMEQFLGLREDLGKLALGHYFAELLEAVSDEDSPNPALLTLGLNSLYALSRGLCPDRQIKAAFELRLLCLAGFRPDVEACAVCGCVTPESPVISLLDGGLRCFSCGGAAQAVPLCPDALAAMRYILDAEPKRFLQFSLPPEAMERLGRAAEAYLLAHLDRGFGTLDYWKRLL